MPIDPTAAPQPLSPEMEAGESYIPKDQPFELPQQQQPIASARDLNGRVPDGDRDLDMAIGGIRDGDPLGMESFDLGFYEDGTPMVRINGANVPIRHEQWMALLTQRNKMRAEFKMRMDFERDRLKARNGITKILASAPSVPPQLGELLLTIADMNPQYALQETNQLLVSMSKDNGAEQIGRLSSLVQDTARDAELGRLFRETEIVEEDAYGEKTVRKTAPLKERYAALSASTDSRNRKTAYAIGNIENMFPPKGLKQRTGGQPVGVFDQMARFEGMDTNELSRYDLLRHLASFHGDLFPATVSWQEPPTDMGNFVGPQVTGMVDWAAAPPEWQRFRNYMRQLDEWANKVLKWDMSSQGAIDAMAGQAIMRGMNAPQQQQQQSAQSAAATAAPPSNGFDF